MNEPRVYKTSPLLFIIIIIFFLFLLGILVFVFGSDIAGFLIPLVIFTLITFGVVLVTLMSKTIVSNDEISVQKLFGAKTLRWTEISQVSGWGDRMKLQSRDEDVTISVSPRLPGYEDVIDTVGTKRPDLFSPLEHNEMRRSLSSYLGVFVVVIVLVGMSALFIFVTLSNSESSPVAYIPLLVIVAMTLFLVVMTLSAPRVLILEGRTMILKYLFSEKNINADEVRLIQLSYTQTRNGKQYFIAMRLTNGKNIRLSGLGMSLPITYLVLKNWHQGTAQGQAFLSNVAPNGSDNSWK